MTKNHVFDGPVQADDDSEIVGKGDGETAVVLMNVGYLSSENGVGTTSSLFGQ